MSSSSGPELLYPREFYTETFSDSIFRIDKRYQNLQPIGHGSYGTVCSAEDTLTGKKVAVKKITNMFEDLVDAKRIVREEKLLKHLGEHKNIVGLVDLFAQPYGTEEFEDLYMIMELYECDLDRILASDQELTEQHIQYFLAQVLRAVKYIHSANVLHRDLKPQNLLVNANCDLAICDFGLGRGISEEVNNPSKSDKLTSYVVTRWYRAPEIILECNNYGKAVDMWSVGCIFAEMLRKKPFLKGRDYMHQLKLILRVCGKPSAEELDWIPDKEARNTVLNMDVESNVEFHEYFPDSSPEAVDLLLKMLKFNPNERITDQEALEHPFLRKFHRVSEEISCREPFDFGFERGYGEEIPQDVLQKTTFDDILYYDRIYKRLVGERPGK